MRFVFSLCLLCLLSLPSYASTKDDLKRVESDLKKNKEIEQEYEDKQADIEKKLNVLRGKLVSATREVQTHEKALLKVQEKSAATQDKIDEATDKLNGQRESLAHLVLALQRLDRLPPQALLARPSAPIDTARTYNLLQDIIPNVSKQAQDVRVTLDELSELHKTFAEQEKKLHEEQSALTDKRDELQKSLDERQALLKKTAKNHDAASSKVAALARQASDLRDLMGRIEQTDRTDEKEINKPAGGSLLSWMGRGAELPVSGQVKTGYGQTIEGGDKSQGLSIVAASGAIVTAPTGGIVRFAGPFRQYKLLVIIQHPNGEHSLLGGLQELYTRVGENVVAGEPIGKLPNGSAGGKLAGDSTHTASLYYERRRNGKPIDPRHARG